MLKHSLAHAWGRVAWTLLHHRVRALLRSAAMAVSAAVELDVDTALELRAALKVVGHKTAHKALSGLRALYTTPPGQTSDVPAHLQGFSQEAHDLTHETGAGAFDWKGYVAGRSEVQIREVVGAGVVRFEMRFLRSIDKNLHQNRCDFVVHRADGTAVRLHPGAKYDAVPVFGCLDEWAISATTPLPPIESVGRRYLDLAASQGPPGSSGSGGPQDRTTAVYDHVSQADAVSRAQAVKFLSDRYEAAQANSWRSPFRMDVTDQRDFAWSHYLAFAKGGADILRAGVVAFWVVWVGRGWQRPGFYVATRDGSEVVIFPGRQQPLVSEAVHDIMWSA